MGKIADPTPDHLDWDIQEYVCTRGPDDHAVEERHEYFTIAVVLEGKFLYRSEHTGTTLMYPGSLLLGNHGSCFECGHDHSRGDRCLAFHMDPEYFAQVGAAAGASSNFRFATSRLSFGNRITPWLSRVEAGEKTGSLLDKEEIVVELMELVVSSVANARVVSHRIAPQDARRMSEIAEFIEQHVTEPIDLPALARMTNLSKYHFLRSFRNTFGITPYQYILAARMRRVARSLLSSKIPVSALAFDNGFADLSTFNSRFREQFGVSPRRFREQR